MQGSLLTSVFRPGIRSKLSWLFLATTILPLTLLGYYANQATGQALTANVLASDAQATRNLRIRLQNFFDRIPEDLLSISHLHSLNQYLYWREIGEPYQAREKRQDTTRVFDAFMRGRQIYRDIQVLNNAGQSLLHLHYHNDTVRLLPSASEQEYALSELVQTVAALEPGAMYNSSLLTLWESDEQGRKQPVRVIRYAIQLLDEQQNQRGILLFSVYASRFLSLIRQQEAEQGKGLHLYRLLNQQGDYLYRSERLSEEDTFKQNDIAQEAPELWARVQAETQGFYLQDATIWSFQRFLPLTGKPDAWILLKETRDTPELAQVAQFKQVFVLILFAVGVGVLILASWFTRRLLHPLLEVNAQLKALAVGRLPEQAIDYHGHDEIGEIIDSTHLVTTSIRKTIEQTNAIASGDFSTQIELRAENDQLGRSLIYMTTTLRDATARTESQDWLKSGQTKLNEEMSGEKNVRELGNRIVRFVATYLKAQLGAFYLLEHDKKTEETFVQMVASYAYSKRKSVSNRFALGEGLVGQAALEGQSIFVTDVPEGYSKIQSGLGDAHPGNILVMPFHYEGELKGLLEIGSFSEFTETQFEFLMQIMPAIGVAINSAQARDTLQKLLERTQSQTEELQSQAEELQAQQEELRQTNEELEERTLDLQRQKEDIRTKNKELEQTQKEIEAKAREVEMASRYKSEFLANMSHELRTPLNSLLILAQMLASNKQGNLSDKQVEYARTIHSAGSDLLSLINEILDLSKVEAGKMEVHAEWVAFRDFIEGIELKFRHVAENKGLGFEVEHAADVPVRIFSDSHRLKQIINNLLSNAFKFTSEGGIGVRIGRPSATQLAALPAAQGPYLSVSVKDSGIGIAPEKQKGVFEAFQQADGTTSRKYGGTGLGLSISRQLARLLGGDLILDSEPGKGSTFTLFFPEKLPGQEAPPPEIASSATPATPSATEPEPASPPTPAPLPQTEQDAALKSDAEREPPLKDDRDGLQAGDRFILIIDDDIPFAEILIETAREKDFKCLYAHDGKTGLHMAEEYQPNAIILDIGLPQLDGLSVMDRLKHNPRTRHIPVHFISAADEGQDARRMGAIGYLLKPLDMGQLGQAFQKIERFIAKTLKNLLMVVDDSQREAALKRLLEDADAAAQTASDCAKALDLLRSHATGSENFDCIILDIDVEQGKGLNLLEQLQSDEILAQIPVILYAAHELSPEQDKRLQELAENLTVKAVRSPERLLDEATLFLHQLEARLPSEKREILHRLHDKQALLAERRVLLVDDDMRNTFALATVLEDNEMEVVVAKDGEEALNLLASEEALDIVLMDIMMPGMDGFEAMRRIRAQDQFRKLPIIALTAKAMKGDKAKCIEAGANDYLTKPVDTDKLLSLMRVWLYQ